MKKLFFSDLTLVSKVERRAIRIQFDPRTTILIGPNDTGKSSVIKSLFWTFGAEPSSDDRWKAAKVIAVLKFSVEAVEYTLLRRENFFALFDVDNSLIKTFENVTNDLAPFLANLLDFKVILSNRSKEPIIPPPAFYFLPFYLDQDRSWTKNWSSFLRLEQIPKFKTDLIDYHTGIRPNEYYVAKATLAKSLDEIDRMNSQERILRDMLVKLSNDLNAIEFNLDIDDFKDDINQLLVECRQLQKHEQKLKEKLVEFNNERIRIDHQVSIVQHAMKEAKLDYKYASGLTEHIDCPMCGAVYENNFATRFDIAMDEGRCVDLLTELDNESRLLDDIIKRENDKQIIAANEIRNIQTILDRRQGEIVFRDVVNSQGKNELKTVFKNNIDEVTQELNLKQREVNELKDRLKKIGDPKRRANILNEYRINMRKYLTQLDVQMEENSYNKIASNMSAQGSELPRALLSYFFSIVKVMEKYSSSVSAPIVIDSPNQQDQDKIKIDKILNFIKNEVSDDRQIIIGVAGLHGVEMPGKIIEFTESYKLLQEEYYDLLNSELSQLLEKALSAGDNRSGSTLSLF